MDAVEPSIVLAGCNPHLCAEAKSEVPSLVNDTLGCNPHLCAEAKALHGVLQAQLGDAIRICALRQSCRQCRWPVGTQMQSAFVR